jgi:hypothetical protein
VNVPSSVINAARQGLILIVSPPDPAGRVHKWRSRLTDAGFLLTAEDGVRYIMPVLDGLPQMIREDLVPALHFYRARVDLEIARGDEMAAAYFATRLTSILGENADTGAGWFDADFLAVAKAALIEKHPERFGPKIIDEVGPMPSYAKIRNATRPSGRG